MKIRISFKPFLLISAFILIFAIILSMTIGTINIDINEIIQIITNRSDNEGYKTIIMKLRLPRALAASLIGAGLSVIGVSYQSIFKNSMAEPYVIGVSAGAALGATIGMIFLNLRYSFVLLNGISFIGALLTLILVYQIAKTKNIIPVTTLLLAGISINFLFSSLISLLMVLNKNQMGEIMFWIMGSLNSVNWIDIGVLTPIIFIGIFIIYYFSRELNIMIMGDETALGLGIDIEKVKKIILFISSIMVAFIVSISGIISFVGLIIPHIVRIIIGSNNKKLIPVSIFVGASFMVVCDILARVLVSPSEIPIGIITALFGSPYFIYLLYKT